MKRLLSRPVTNAVGLGLFSAFYGLIFVATAACAAFKDLPGDADAAFWRAWSAFLAAGRQRYIAYALIALTLVVIVFLVARRHPYDEYQTAVLTRCLVAAVVLTLGCIAVFYLMILGDASGVVQKFTLFVAVNWATVVLADLIYVLVCGWK